MPLDFDHENRKLIFKGELTVFEIEDIHNLVKSNEKVLHEWNNFYLDLNQVEKIDSSFIQFFLSLMKTYPKKIHFSSINKEIREIFQKHGLKFKKS